MKGTAAMSSAPEARHTVIAALSPELDELASNVMADWKVPGAALAVAQDGKVALVKSYGQRDVDADLPVTSSTKFLIGSITKTFTATAVALLHNEERLDWTKPVRDYIPEFWLHDAVEQPKGHAGFIARDDGSRYCDDGHATTHLCAVS